MTKSRARTILKIVRAPFISTILVPPLKKRPPSVALVRQVWLCLLDYKIIGTGVETTTTNKSHTAFLLLF